MNRSSNVLNALTPASKYYTFRRDRHVGQVTARQVPNAGRKLSGTRRQRDPLPIYDEIDRQAERSLFTQLLSLRMPSSWGKTRKPGSKRR